VKRTIELFRFSLTRGENGGVPMSTYEEMRKLGNQFQQQCPQHDSQHIAQQQAQQSSGLE
jgi:hypothetical protein